MIHRTFLNWLKNWMRDAGFRTQGQSRRSRRPEWAPQVVQLESRTLMSGIIGAPGPGFGPEADAFEADNTAATAAVIATTGAPQEHSFHSGTDTDWVTFTLGVQSNVTIQTAGVTGGDTRLDLYRGSSRALTFVQTNNDYMANSLYSRIDRKGATSLSAGTYFVKITENGQNETLSSYTISVSASDVFELDNTAAQAKTIQTNGSVQEHSLHSGTDVDWVTFTLGVPSNVTILTAGDAPADTIVDLYTGPANLPTLIETNDNYAPGSGYSRIERLGNNSLPAGTYLVRISGNRQNSPLSRYAISVNATDLFESDDVSTQAKPIATDGTFQEHSFPTDSDVDWVTFTLPIRSNVSIVTSGNSGGDTKLDLFGPNSSTIPITSNDNDGMTLYSRLECIDADALPAGTYHLRITGQNGGSGLSRYTVSILAKDLYEDDNEVARATQISTDNVAQSHSFHTRADVDWYKFTLTTTTTVNIVTAGAAGTGTSLELYDHKMRSAAGVNNVNPTNTYATLSRRLGPGTYYVRLTEAGMDAVLGLYTMRIWLS